MINNLGINSTHTVYFLDNSVLGNDIVCEYYYHIISSANTENEILQSGNLIA